MFATMIIFLNMLLVSKIILYEIREESLLTLEDVESRIQERNDEIRKCDEFNVSFQMEIIEPGRYHVGISNGFFYINKEDNNPTIVLDNLNMLNNNDEK